MILGLLGLIVLSLLGNIWYYETRFSRASKCVDITEMYSTILLNRRYK